MMREMLFMPMIAMAAATRAPHRQPRFFSRRRRRLSCTLPAALYELAHLFYYA